MNKVELFKRSKEIQSARLKYTTLEQRQSDLLNKEYCCNKLCETCQENKKTFEGLKELIFEYEAETIALSALYYEMQDLIKDLEFELEDK